MSICVSNGLISKLLMAKLSEGVLFYAVAATAKTHCLATGMCVPTAGIDYLCEHTSWKIVDIYHVMMSKLQTVFHNGHHGPQCVGLRRMKNTQN